MEHHAVGHEVPDADSLPAAVDDLHVLDDDAVDRGLVLLTLGVGVGAGGAGA